jgi:hypothetical protein
MDAHLVSLRAGIVKPDIVRGALDAIPKIDDETAAAIIQNYITSLKG